MLLPSPLLLLGSDRGAPIVRVPAVADASLRVVSSNGVTATLVGDGLPAARWPAAWLPDGIEIGEEVRLTTAIEPGGSATRFEIALASRTQR
ncbi:MAG: hypothetical protein U5K81_08235 [Trueperaceae bacterium]|nr:hypothetical protein [Trueperaceae bacterium]